MLLNDHKVTVDIFITYNYIQPVLSKLKHYLTLFNYSNKNNNDYDDASISISTK